IPQFVAVRIISDAFAQELLSLGHFAKRMTQPISRDRISINSMRIQFRRDSQPRQNFPFIASFEVGVLSDQKVSTKLLNPVSGRSEEVHVFFVCLSLVTALLSGH